MRLPEDSAAYAGRPPPDRTRRVRRTTGSGAPEGRSTIRSGSRLEVAEGRTEARAGLRRGLPLLGRLEAHQIRWTERGELGERVHRAKRGLGRSSVSCNGPISTENPRRQEQQFARGLLQRVRQNGTQGSSPPGSSSRVDPEVDGASRSVSRSGPLTGPFEGELPTR